MKAIGGILCGLVCLSIALLTIALMLCWAGVEWAPVLFSVSFWTAVVSGIGVIGVAGIVREEK